MANTIMSAKNSFQDGLLLDFSPENSKATSMTAALNATLVTFNGNEMSLQNDMGNGRVETAFLPEGYVPVGSCEFGDIIYIVSYNPLINKSQIGCFPSPERNISSEELGGLQQSLSWKDFQEGDTTPNGELKASSVKKILYDNRDMTPGDKYIIYSSDLKQTSNNQYLSDYGNKIHEHGEFPKLAKIHVVSIEESGKIVYLDSTTKWYDNNYYLNADLEVNGGLKDIDSYRTMVSSAYSVFSSKVSGKLALLVELEKITGFSCSWEPYIDSSDSLDSEGLKYTNYSIYWNFNWTTNNNNINPDGAILVTSEWTGVDKNREGQYQNWKVNGSKIELSNTSWTYIGQLPTPYNNGGYQSWNFSRYYKPENNISFDSFISTYSYDKYLEETIKDLTTGNLSIPYKLSICRNESIPQEGSYYVNCTNVIDSKYYTQDINGAVREITATSLKDDFVNNYFHYPIVKKFASFNIPTKQILNVNGETIEKTPNISNLIYHYEVAPTMPYGILREFTQEGYIDFSKIGTKSIALNTWKYYNYENTSTLTWGMEAYTEPGKGISEVVFEFYDNQRFVAAYHTKGKNSYNGVFTEYITLSESGSNYKLNNVDHKGVVHTHKGLEVAENDRVQGINYIKEGNKYYQDDSGTLYPNLLYLVKIIIKYCNKGVLDEYIETDDSYIEDYRWFWTNTMFNEYYYQVNDFKKLQFNLNLDCNAIYDYKNSGSISDTVLYQGVPNSDTTVIASNEHTQLKANVTYINQGSNTSSDTNGNIQCKLQAGLTNSYNTFNLEEKGLSNINVTTYLGSSSVTSSIEQPKVISTEDLGYVFPGIYPLQEKPETINDVNYVAKLTSEHGNNLHTLLKTSQSGSGDEINITGASYKKYTNTFSLTFPSIYADSEETINYLTSTGQATPESGVLCKKITKNLKDVEYNYGNSSIFFTLTGVIYSKFYELRQLLSTDVKVVKPLLYDDQDLQKYNMYFSDSNKCFYFNQFGGICIGDDDDGGTRTRIRFYKQDIDLNTGRISKLDSPIHKYEAYKEAHRFWSDEIQQFDESLRAPNVYPGITPFLLVRHDSFGKDYAISKGIVDSPGTTTTESYEMKKYFESFITNFNKNEESAMHADLQGATNNNTFVVLALKSTNDCLHLLNTFIPVQYSGYANNRYVSQNIRYSSTATGEYRPTTVGDAVASLLMNLYYTTGSTETTTYLGTSNFIYLDNHQYIFNKDIIYKLEIIDKNSTEQMITILGLKYQDYLQKVIQNAGYSYDTLKKDYNVNLIINSIQKNCPIQFQFGYITPVQQLDTKPQQVIKCSDGSVITSNIGFVNNRLYAQNTSNPTEFNRIEGGFFNYYPYQTFNYSAGSQYIGTRTNTLINNSYISKNFVLEEDQLMCKNTNSNNIANNNAISINGKEEWWSGITPIVKQECLLTMGEVV